MVSLKEHLNYRYVHVEKVIGGVGDEIDAFDISVSKINEKIKKLFPSTIKDVEFLVLYDNTKHGEKYKSRVFDFYIKYHLDNETNLVNMLNIEDLIQSLKRLLREGSNSKQ
jgi:hypothetical protein